MDNNTIENGNENLAFLQDNGLPLAELLYVVLRHRWIILSTIVLFLLCAFLYLLKATPIYTSASRLYVEQSGPKIINEYEGVMTRSKNYLYTQAELMKSTPIVAGVVDDPQIKQFRTFNNVDNLVGYVKKNLGVVIGKQDDIISVSFDSPYPVEAAQIANAVVDSYISYHRASKSSTASQVRDILQKEKVKCDRELRAKFEEMLAFTRENGVLSFDNEGGHIVLQKLGKLSDALTETQLATINAKADFEAARSMANEPAKVKQFAAASPSSGVQVFVNDIETQLRSELKEAEVELKNARYHCTEDHPSVKAIQTKIEHINRQLNEEAKEFADAYIDVMQIRWEAAKQRANELELSFDGQCQAAQGLGIKAAEYSVLQSELRRIERLSDILDDRIKELNVTEDVGALNISILEVAGPAGSPSRPQRAKIMALALALGIMFGCSLAFLRNWLDYRLQSVEEISAVLGVPVLGVVPTMSEERAFVTHSQKVWLGFRSVAVEVCRTIRAIVPFGAVGGKTAAVDVTSPVSHSEGVISEKQPIIRRAQRVRSEFRTMSRKSYRAARAGLFSEEADRQVKPAAVASPVSSDNKTRPKQQATVARGQKVHLQPRSMVAEAYRTIRTAVFFGVPKGEAKTILVTSPEPADGKSTLVSNLAIAMAQAGQKTLILDADFRKPIQHKIFEFDNEKGLSNVLAGTVTLAEAVRSGPVELLDVLGCGREVPNPSEILSSNSFSEVLKYLSEHYDRVIIDSPPVTSLADSQILAAICDVTLLVLRAEKSTRRHSQHARDILLSVGGSLLGTVVNDVPRKRSHYGYYRGYGYYGHYGHGYYGSREKKKEKEQVA